IGQPISCQSDLEAAKRSRERMKKLSIGDVTIISIIERDGPWRTPQEMFPAYDPINGKRHLAELDPKVFDPPSGKMVITYQTYIVRTPRHTVLIDTCTGEDKGYPPPMDFPNSPGSTVLRPWACASKTSIMCSARICISTIAAGTRCCATDAGCGHFRKPNIFSTKANMPPGRNRQARRNPRRRRRQCVSLQLPADRRSWPGAARRRRLSARR